MKQLTFAAAMLLAGPASAQSVCAPDANGRYSAACVRAAKAQGYAEGVERTCRGVGWRYSATNGPACTHPARLAGEGDDDAPPPDTIR
ncbi:hypothetical protein [Algicella marina]|uniref:Uncharacterized protein n=1 Tax=Algicella marina TaxID=2683284 RepID=A0A6P1T0D3_9RHOB|nr:hypothetical protein [Algicella marina]QHQ33962.1 hypothetical protein GO499_01575 [Algicella marina]